MINAPMLKSILIGAALLTTASTVAAQAYPTRPVRFVVPYAPGASGSRRSCGLLNQLPAASATPAIASPRTNTAEALFDNVT